MKKADHVLACSIKEKKKEEAKFYKRSKNKGEKTSERQLKT